MNESPIPRERVVAYLRDGEILARELLAEAEAVNIDRHRRAILSHDLGFAMGQFHQALSMLHAAIGVIRDNSYRTESP